MPKLGHTTQGDEMNNSEYPKLSEFISEHYSENEAAKIRDDAQEEFAKLQNLQENGAQPTRQP